MTQVARRSVYRPSRWALNHKEVSYEDPHCSHVSRPARRHGKANWFLAGRARRSLLRAEGSGAAITLASPKGGQPPLDPKSDLPENQTKLTKRFRADTAAQVELAQTKKLADVSADDFDAVFYPGGHGPMWEVPDNATSIALIEAFVKADKPVGAVCHAPVALVNVRGKDGEYLVKGKRVTGFTNAEEEAVGLTAVVPFLLETG